MMLGGCCAKGRGLAQAKTKEDSSSCPGLGSLRVTSLTAVKGGLEFVVAERQLGSRGNGLRGGVFVTDSI